MHRQECLCHGYGLLEESGRPRFPVTEQITGSNPVQTAKFLASSSTGRMADFQSLEVGSTPTEAAMNGRVVQRIGPQSSKL